MVSTPAQFINNSKISTNLYVTVKNPSARKPLRQFSEALDFKHKTAVCKLGADKSKSKARRADNTLWSSISKCCGHTKINQQLK